MGLNQCDTCGRGPCLKMLQHHKVLECSNCYALRRGKNLTRVCRLANQYCIEVGACQVCRVAAATVIWDTANQTRVTTVGCGGNDNEDIYVWSRPYDLTAACTSCIGDRGPAVTRGFPNYLSLTQHGTLGEALPQHKKWWAKCLAETVAAADATPAPEQPTAFVPGSREKLDVLRQRAMAGQSLFHEADRIGSAERRWDGDHDEADPLVYKYAVPSLGVVYRCLEAARG